MLIAWKRIEAMGSRVPRIRGSLLVRAALGLVTQAEAQRALSPHQWLILVAAASKPIDSRFRFSASLGSRFRDAEQQIQRGRGKPVPG